MNTNSANHRLEFAFPPRAVRAIGFIGDSRAGIFSDLILTDRTNPSEPVITRSRWKPILRSAMFWSGRFDEEMTRFLWELRFIRPVEGDAPEIFSPMPYRGRGGAVEEFRFDLRETRAALVVSCGIGDAWDVSATDARGAICKRLEPLWNGLQALRAAGAERLFLLGLPPQPPGVLHEVIVEANAANAEFCRAHGVGFLDLWDDLLEDGVRRERYFNDEIHMNYEGALLTLNRLVEML